MTKQVTYTNLSDEDKLLMDGLFKYKKEKEDERKIIRNIISRLRRREMDCTKEIMNLSQKKISEKFDLTSNSAKPLSMKNRKKLLNEKKIRKPRRHNRGIAPDFWCNC